MEKLKNMRSNAIITGKVTLIVVFYTGTVALLLSEVARAATGGA
ncbi:MAG: hypothetical protein V3T24_08690 [Longimicrobiales bacterium]